MTRIFIEDQELDVNQGFTNQLTYSVDDLNNLDSKTTSFSKTIVLPGTNTNNRLLGNIFEVGNANFTSDFQPNVGYNFNASKSAKVRVEVDGIQVMKGVLRLLEIIIDGEYVEYEVALFGELGGFFSKLSALKLTDLDFSEYNHVYNVTNIQNSWNSAGSGSGYYYPLIDYGNVSSPTDLTFFKRNFYFTAFRPAFYVKEYLSKIITDAGYTYESNFFNTNFFKRLIIPNNQSRLKFNRLNVFESTIQPANPILSPIENIEHSNIVNDLFSNSANQTFTYTPATTFSGNFNLVVQGNFKVTNSDISDTVYRYAYASLVIYKNGVPEYVDTTKKFGGFATTLGLSQPPSYRFALRFFGIPVSFSTGDTWKFALQIFDTDGAVIDVTLNNSTCTLNSNAPVLTSAQYGDTLLVNSTLPANILQKDFFASILKMFNLMVTESKYKEKHLIIEPNVNFYDLDRSSYQDWTDKVDRSQVLKIKPMSEVNARYYDFKYKSDTDYYNEEYRKKYAENYGDRRYDNQLEFAKDASSLEVIFSATPIVGYSGNDKVLSTIFKKNNNVEEMIEHNIRIMQVKKITGVSGWAIYAANNNVLAQSLTSYGYAGHLDDPNSPTSDLNFGSPKEFFFNLSAGNLSNNIFNTYYSSYMAEITDKDSRLLTCKMKLTQQDIFNLDFGRFVYIDGVLYRLTKIKDWSENEICEVELLRVIYTTY